LGGAVRAGAEAFYYNSFRFLPANLLFGAALLVVATLLLVGPIGFVAAVGLIPLSAGVMRMATHYVRHRYVFFSEFWQPMRRWPGRVLLLGVAQLGLITVLVVDFLVGAGMESWFGTFLAVSALYALLVLWIFSLIVWPLVLDPEREDEPVRAQLRLAALLVLAHPVRMTVFGGVIGAIVLISTVAIVAIATFALALAWLVVAHYVLPAADRFEGRATLEVPED
jgi:uncharacterized membrane protein YesL